MTAVAHRTQVEGGTCSIGHGEVPPLDGPVRVRPRATAFDPPPSEITVATPSCCCSCSCCCCAVTLVTVTSFTASVGLRRYAELGTGRGMLGGYLAMLSVPLALVLTGMLQTELLPVTAAGVAVVVFGGLFAGGLVLTGMRWGQALVLAGATVAIAALAFVAEFFVAIITVFVFELLIPVGIYLGVRWGRSWGVPDELPAGPPLAPEAEGSSPDDGDGSIWPPGAP